MVTKIHVSYLCFEMITGRGHMQHVSKHVCVLNMSKGGSSTQKCPVPISPEFLENLDAGSSMPCPAVKPGTAWLSMFRLFCQSRSNCIGLVAKEHALHVSTCASKVVSSGVPQGQSVGTHTLVC